MIQNKKIIVTGVTGLIGSALVKRLIKNNNEVICPVRNQRKARRILGEDNYHQIICIETSLENFFNKYDLKTDYLIHCASPTSSKAFIEEPVETLMFNAQSTFDALSYCRKFPVNGFIFLSSLESYGTVLDDAEPIDEDYQGYVNPLEVRSSYNMAKRFCETLCHSYYEEYNVPTKIVRLTQTISSEIEPSDNRIFAQFAKAAALGQDIILHTEGLSSRQYVYIEDVIDAILLILEKGENGQAYNVANEDTYISAKDMAQFVQTNFNPTGKIIFNLRNDMGYAPATKIKLNTTKVKNLGWQPKFNLYQMYDAIITNLRNQTSAT